MSTAIWKMVPIYIFFFFFCVWKERNLGCFENLESFMEVFLTSFFHTMYLWTVAFCPHCQLALLISLFVFLFLVMCFLLYTSSVLNGALRFQ